MDSGSVPDPHPKTYLCFVYFHSLPFSSRESFVREVDRLLNVKHVSSVYLGTSPPERTRGLGNGGVVFRRMVLVDTETDSLIKKKTTVLM